MTTKSLFRILIILVLISELNVTSAQSPGDTIRVQAFNFDSSSRDSLIAFPTDENITYEKILLNYTMRCKDGLVSTAANRNLGCGEWDFSCNTYLADSSKIEAAEFNIPSHFITNYDDSTFPYKETPVYDYIRGTQTTVSVTSTNNEIEANVGTGSETLDRSMSTANPANKSQYLYTAEELIAAGLTSGEIHGLNLMVLEDAGEAQFLQIKMKNSSKVELDGIIDNHDFTEVYYNDHTFQPNSANRFHFHDPFIWDGSSSLLVEFSFTNINENLSGTLLAGESTNTNMGLSSINETEIILTNNAYVECNDYTGVEGSQNRTIETWIKTTDGSNGEIISFGTINEGTKWVWRLANGLLRLEITGGGTVSSTRVDDGEWHHIACVLNGDNLSDISFVIDGVLDTNSETGNLTLDTGSSNLRISRGVNNRYMNANIDEVRVWDTNLSVETINEWKNLKLDESHPNYDNLQLYYQFNGEGSTVSDSSPYGRDATVIGTRFNTTEISGQELYRDFNLEKNRPNIAFFQGDYTTTSSTVELDRPIAKQLKHLVLTRSIEITNPLTVQDDIILNDEPVEYWLPEQIIYDEATGDIIDIISLDEDGEIEIDDLEYTRRFPFYNELLSFVTPYGIGLDFGLEGVAWTFDMSDYASILKGKKRLLLTLGGQNQEDMDLEFLFIVGTPPRDVIQYEQLWQGTNRQGIASITQIQTDQKFSSFNVDIPNDAESVMLKSSITGHGSEGEFQQNGGIINHRINIDGSQQFNWSINKECSFNPIFPQGGTWIYDRQGWCPGERSIVTENEITELTTPGESVNIDYGISSPQVFNGDYRYHAAHQLVSYGQANFQSDASILKVIAPNNSAEFRRVGTVCANPTIMIQNTGGNELTNLSIKYWINDSQAPQTFEWTGNLSFMQTEEVILPNREELWYDILSDNNKFYAEISNPNGTQDEYAHNNATNSRFDFPDVLPVNITIEFRTNNLPNENSYQLMDIEGNVVGANDLTTSNNTFQDDYELAEGCYKLIVTDSGGDGVQWWANPTQGTGFINILDDSGSDIIEFEPDFGGGFEFSFSTSFPVSTENLDFLSSIEVFPNPASNYISIKADDITETSFSMINSMGQTVKESILSQDANEMRFDVSNLTSGLYYIVIQKDKIITTRKVIVE